MAATTAVPVLDEHTTDLALPVLDEHTDDETDMPVLDEHDPEVHWFTLAGLMALSPRTRIQGGWRGDEFESSRRLSRFDQCYGFELGLEDAEGGARVLQVP